MEIAVRDTPAATAGHHMQKQMRHYFSMAFHLRQPTCMGCFHTLLTPLRFVTNAMILRGKNS
jgi:hypothetical protein